MNHKHLTLVLSMLMSMAVCSMTLVSCGDDDEEKIASSVSGNYNGYMYVDLGLPSGTLWATMNVGAYKPEDYGYYLAWGETKPKSEYKLENYFDFYYDDLRGYYCVSSKSKYKADGNVELLPEDDAAYVNWGEGWRMPTNAQFEELKTQCEWKGVNYNGVDGFLVKSKSNKNVLFLPSAGYHQGDHMWGSPLGYYWSRSLDASNTSSAWYLSFTAGGTGHMMPELFKRQSRCSGQSVRPVRASQ